MRLRFTNRTYRAGFFNYDGYTNRSITIQLAGAYRSRWNQKIFYKYIKMVKANILVVDDMPAELHMQRKILEKAGYHVETATNGAEGFVKAKELLPDLILMNWVMPVLDGCKATRKLKDDKDTRHIPVIMYSCKSQETDIAWAKYQGAVDYLVSPVEISELLKKVEQHLPKNVKDNN